MLGVLHIQAYSTHTAPCIAHQLLQVCSNLLVQCKLVQAVRPVLRKQQQQRKSASAHCHAGLFDAYFTVLTLSTHSMVSVVLLSQLR
jgi:hypothetical protein